MPQNFLARRTVPIIGNIHLSIIGFARILFLRGNPITFFFDEKVRFFNFAKKQKRTPIYWRKSKKVRFFLDFQIKVALKKDINFYQHIF